LAATPSALSLMLLFPSGVHPKPERFWRYSVRCIRTIVFAELISQITTVVGSPSVAA